MGKVYFYIAEHGIKASTEAAFRFLSTRCDTGLKYVLVHLHAAMEYRAKKTAVMLLQNAVKRHFDNSQLSNYVPHYVGGCTYIWGKTVAKNMRGVVFAQAYNVDMHKAFGLEPMPFAPMYLAGSMSNALDVKAWLQLRQDMSLKWTRYWEFGQAAMGVTPLRLELVLEGVSPDAMRHTYFGQVS